MRSDRVRVATRSRRRARETRAVGPAASRRRARRAPGRRRCGARPRPAPARRSATRRGAPAARPWVATRPPSRGGPRAPPDPGRPPRRAGPGAQRRRSSSRCRARTQVAAAGQQRGLLPLQPGEPCAHLPARLPGLAVEPQVRPTRPRPPPDAPPPRGGGRAPPGPATAARVPTPRRIASRSAASPWSTAAAIGFARAGVPAPRAPRPPQGPRPGCAGADRRTGPSARRRPAWTSPSAPRRARSSGRGARSTRPAAGGRRRGWRGRRARRRPAAARARARRVPSCSTPRPPPATTRRTASIATWTAVSSPVPAARARASAAPGASASRRASSAAATARPASSVSGAARTARAHARARLGGATAPVRSLPTTTHTSPTRRTSPRDGKSASSSNHRRMAPGRACRSPSHGTANSAGTWVSRSDATGRPAPATPGTRHHEDRSEVERPTDGQVAVEDGPMRGPASGARAG